MRSFSTKIAGGAAWMIAARLSDRSIGLVSTVILARILVPADFGLVVMATAILAAIQLLGAFSFDLALIQKQDAERRHYDTVWTVGLLFAAAFALVLILLSHPAAGFYHEPRLAGVMYVLALGTFLDGFTNVGIVAFRKEMQFDKEFKFLFTKRLATVIVTVTLAVVWRDYWALVAGSLTGTVVSVALSYAWHPYRPRLSLEARTELFRFSWWLFVNNTLGFLYHRAADFILAKGAGPAGLGHYSVAYEIANLPSSELVAPVHRAVFPGYAKISGDIAAMRRGFINIVSMIALITVPAAVGLACIAAPVVRVALGPQWDTAIPLIRVLALNGVLAALWTCSGYVYLALGKPRNVTLVLGTQVLLATPMITVAAFNWGVVYVAWAVLLSSLAVWPLNYLLLSKALQLRLVDLLRAVWRPAVGATVMAVSLFALQRSFAPATHTAMEFVHLLFSVLAGATIYGVCVAALWRLSARPAGAETFVLGRLAYALTAISRASR